MGNLPVVQQTGNNTKTPDHQLMKQNNKSRDKYRATACSACLTLIQQATGMALAEHLLLHVSEESYTTDRTG